MGLRAQFRFDAYNLFSHPVLAVPGNTCVDCAGSTAGQITDIEADSAPGAPIGMRQLQFGFRVACNPNTPNQTGVPRGLPVFMLDNSLVLAVSRRFLSVYVYKKQFNLHHYLQVSPSLSAAFTFR